MTCEACVPAPPNRVGPWAPCFGICIRLRRLFWLSPLAFILLAPPGYPQANGKLQLHFMDVGQGDGAVLISPGGEVVLFDDGRYKYYVDYLIVSHYHADHIGCTKEVLDEFLLQKAVYDRGGAGVFVTKRGKFNGRICKGDRRTVEPNRSRRSRPVARP